MVGFHFGVIEDSYATGRVFNNTYAAGGLVGLHNGTINKSYATGQVVGSGWVGGLTGFDGRDRPATTTNSYWDTTSSGVASSASGTGKTTAQMQQKATYAGWDFDNTWMMPGNDLSPVLGISLESLKIRDNSSTDKTVLILPPSPQWIFEQTNTLQKYSDTASLAGQVFDLSIIKPLHFMRASDVSKVMATIEELISNGIDPGAYARLMYKHQNPFFKKLDFASNSLEMVGNSLQALSTILTVANKYEYVMDGSYNFGDGVDLGISSAQTSLAAAVSVGNSIAVAASPYVGAVFAGAQLARLTSELRYGDNGDLTSQLITDSENIENTWKTFNKSLQSIGNQMIVGSISVSEAKLKFDREKNAALELISDITNNSNKLGIQTLILLTGENGNAKRVSVIAGKISLGINSVNWIEFVESANAKISLIDAYAAVN